MALLPRGSHGQIKELTTYWRLCFFSALGALMAKDKTPLTWEPLLLSRLLTNIVHSEAAVSKIEENLGDDCFCE